MQRTMNLSGRILMGSLVLMAGFGKIGGYRTIDEGRRNGR